VFGRVSVNGLLFESSMTKNQIFVDLMLLSLFVKNLPKILMANTRRPLSDLISMIVKTVSYNIEFPTFLADSVFVATYSTNLRI